MGQQHSSHMEYEGVQNVKMRNMEFLLLKWEIEFKLKIIVVSIV